MSFGGGCFSFWTCPRKTKIMEVAVLWFIYPKGPSTPSKKVFWGGFRGLSPFSGGTWTLRDSCFYIYMWVCFASLTAVSLCDSQMEWDSETRL